jgi:hypothetical protein
MTVAVRRADNDEADLAMRAGMPGSAAGRSWTR